MTKPTETVALPPVPSLGQYRAIYINAAPEQLRGLSEDLRAAHLAYSYASKQHPGTRYVRADRFIREFGPLCGGLTVESKLDRAAAHTLAEAFVKKFYGDLATRLNNHSLDVSPTNVIYGPEAA